MRNQRLGLGWRCFFRGWIGLGLAAGLVWIGGCVPPQKPMELCPGKATREEVIETLRARQVEMLSLRSSVSCVMEYTDSQGKSKKESFDGTLRFVGPDRVYLGGEKFGPIRIGANPETFWMYVKPGLDTAWYGPRKHVMLCPEKIGFNPFYLTDALGQIDLSLDWMLTGDPGFDVLTVVESTGIRRVYINCCSYQVERIEYCDRMGKLIASADLSNYKMIPDVGDIPGMIDLRHFRSSRMDTRLQLKLSGIAVFKPTEAQMRLFVRPEPKGFEAVYQLNEFCEFVPDRGQAEGRL
ncbi:MAG: hypothetical protein ABFD91_01260 [Anaerohalosphaeraceae bacterium]